MTLEDKIATLELDLTTLKSEVEALKNAPVNPSIALLEKHVLNNPGFDISKE